MLGNLLIACGAVPVFLGGVAAGWHTCLRQTGAGYDRMEAEHEARMLRLDAALSEAEQAYQAKVVLN